MDKGQQLRGPVRVTMPASVAYDLNALQKGIANLVERLGCSPCFSGADCLFQLERDFVIDEKAQVIARAAQVRLPTDPVPWSAGGFVDSLITGPRPEPWITARVNSAVSYDLKRVQESVAKLVGLLGCRACCSGFDILFRQEREFLVDEQANVRGF